MRKKTSHINIFCFWGFLALFFVCSISASGARFCSHADSFRKNLCSFENKKDAGDTSTPVSKLLFIDDNEETEDDDLNHPVSYLVFTSSFSPVQFSISENSLDCVHSENSIGKTSSIFLFIRKFQV